MSPRKRANGEGSIFRQREGLYGAYAWVTTPDGKRRRKYVYGSSREDVHGKWISLQQEARQGPVTTQTPTLAEYLVYWLQEVVRPTLKPKTAETYAMHVRLHILPALGRKRLNKLAVRDVRRWLNTLAETCQCCAQGKDAARGRRQRRCCAIGQCCQQRLSRRTIADIRAVLRSALNNAISEELIAKNPADTIRLPSVRSRRIKPWTVEEARQFLESARRDRDPMYTAYVLILVLGLRRGEVLGLTWPMVNIDEGEIEVSYGLQRIGGRLVNGETKTPSSDAILPLPDICATALRLQRLAHDNAKAQVGPLWADSGYVITAVDGQPMDPRNFYRAFQKRCLKAGVRQIPVHGTRHTCGSLLAALDVHPRVAMQILRHSKIAVTMEIYTHIPSDVTRRALRRLGDHLDGVDDKTG